MVRIVESEALDFSTLVRGGDFVVWGQGCGEPLELTKRLMEQRQEIGAFEAFIGISLSDTPNPDFTDFVRFTSFCGTGRNARLAATGNLDIIPLHYSRLVQTLSERIDVLLVQVAEDQVTGQFSLSSSCDYVHELIPFARTVIAEINRQAPLTDAPVDSEAFDVIVRSDYRPLTLTQQAPSPDNQKIANHVAEMVGDGATLQLGLGAVPDCVAPLLANHKRLGFHSGVLSDAAMALIQCGSIDNSQMPFEPGISIAGSLLGSPSLLAFADRNPAIALRPISYTHDIGRIAMLPRFTAINSALEIDLSGQANTECVTGRHYGGAIGGAVDFSRAAHASQGGLPILALSALATRKDGTTASRIVPRLSGPATIGRADIGIIVTEYGIADLRGLSLNARARRLIAIADPRFQDELAAALADQA